MNVKEMRDFLDSQIQSGRADWPVQVMIVEEGITYAGDIRPIVAVPEDGDRIWLIIESQTEPEWIQD